MNTRTLHQFLPLLVLLLLLSACVKDEDAQLAPNARVEAQTETLENELKAKLSDYQIVELDLEALARQAAAASPNTPVELLIENGLETPWLFELSPTPIFAKNFEWSYHDGKAMIQQDGSHIWSLTGNLAGHHHSKVVMTMDGKFLFASLSVDGTHYTIEPLFMQAKTNNLHKYIIYKDTDVLANLQTPPPLCNQHQAAEDLATNAPNKDTPEKQLTAISGNVAVGVLTDMTYYNYFFSLASPAQRNPGTVSALITVFTIFTLLDIDANVYETIFPGTANGLVISAIRVTTPGNNHGYTPAVATVISAELDTWQPWHIANRTGLLNNADIGLLIRHYAYTGHFAFGTVEEIGSVCSNPDNSCAVVTRRNFSGVTFSQVLFRNAIAHEIGHLLGANHPDSPLSCRMPVPPGSELMTSVAPTTIAQGNILGGCVWYLIFDHFTAYNDCL